MRELRVYSHQRWRSFSRKFRFLVEPYLKKPHFLKACPTEFLFNKNTSKKPLGFGFSVLGERPHLSPSVFGSLFRGDIYLGGPGSSSLGSAHPRRPRARPTYQAVCSLRNASRPGLPSSSLEIKRVSFNAVLSEKDYFFLKVIFLKTVPPCESRCEWKSPPQQVGGREPRGVRPRTSQPGIEPSPRCSVHVR